MGNIFRLNEKGHDGSVKALFAVLVIACFLLGFAVSVLVLQVKRATLPIKSANQNATTDDNTTPVPAFARLTLNTAKLTLKTGEKFDVSIRLSSPERGVEAGDFIVYFDPRFVRANTIVPGKYFQNLPVQKIESNHIKISAIASLENNKVTIPKGEGIVATLKFTAIAPMNGTLIYFDPDKTVIGSEGRNILEGVNTISLTIQ